MISVQTYLFQSKFGFLFIIELNTPYEIYYDIYTLYAGYGLNEDGQGTGAGGSQHKDEEQPVVPQRIAEALAFIFTVLQRYIRMSTDEF